MKSNVSVIIIIAAFFALAPASVSAQLGSEESFARGVPIEALVMQNGSMLLDTQVSIRFTLYDSDDDAAWSEEWSNLDSRSCGTTSDCRATIRDGRLSAVLGTHNDLDATLLAVDDYDVGYAVYDGAEWREISTRIPLSPVSYAMWATTTGSFTTTAPVVGGEVTVEGVVDVSRIVVGDGNNLSATSVSGSVLDSSGAIRAASLQVDGQVHMDSTDWMYVGGNVQDASGRTVLSPGSGDYDVQIGEGIDGTVVFENEVRVDDSLETIIVTANGGVSMEGAYIEAQAPFRMDWINVGSDGVQNTGISATDWMCWVGGFDFGDGAGNICRHSVRDCRSTSVGSCSGTYCGDAEVGQCVNGGCTYAPFFEVYLTTNSSGNWEINADVSGENLPSEVGVVCSRTRASNFACDADWTILGGYDLTWVNSGCRNYVNDPTDSSNDSTQWWAGTGDYFPSGWQTRLGATP